MNFVRSNTFWVTLCGLLIIGAIFLVAFTGDGIKYGEADISPEVIQRAQQVAAGQASRTDTDKDGLYDWEETLWGTDPAKADSDGDGDSDGDEVDKSRNPIDAGSEDTLKVDAATGDVMLPGSEPGELNATDKVSQAFFVKYLELKQAGLLEDPAAQQELFQSITQNIIKKSSYRPLTEKDLLVGNTEGTVAAKAYATMVASVLSAHPGGSESEAIILLRALQEESAAEIEKLEPIVESYQAIFSDFKTVVVPRDAVRVHLDLLNATGALEQTIRDMRLAFTDAVVMFSAVSRYPQELTMLESSLKQLEAYLLRNKVEFTSGEVGALLFEIVPKQ